MLANKWLKVAVSFITLSISDLYGTSLPLLGKYIEGNSLYSAYIVSLAPVLFVLYILNLSGQIIACSNQLLGDVPGEVPLLRTWRRFLPPTHSTLYLTPSGLPGHSPRPD